MHLGLNWQALCAPYQLMGALLFCWSSRWPPRMTLLMSSGSKKEPRYTCLSEAKASHKHRMWVEVSSCAAHLLHSGQSNSPVRWRWLLTVLWRGADKSLAPPGRKQATATKLGIYSTHSPRSSVHFLARYSNFCKPLKKIRRFVRPTSSLRGNNDLRVGRKMATFELFFQSREQVTVKVKVTL